MKTLSFASLVLVALAASANAQQVTKPPREQSPADQRAPKGMCRIWLKEVPAARQPAPTDCAAAVKNCPPNGRVIFGDSQESKNRPKEIPESSDPKKASPLVKPLTGKPPLLTGKPPFGP